MRSLGLIKNAKIFFDKTRNIIPEGSNNAGNSKVLKHKPVYSQRN